MPTLVTDTDLQPRASHDSIIEIFSILQTHVFSRDVPDHPDTCDPISKCRHDTVDTDILATLAAKQREQNLALNARVNDTNNLLVQLQTNIASIRLSDTTHEIYAVLDNFIFIISWNQFSFPICRYNFYNFLNSLDHYIQDLAFLFHELQTNLLYQVLSYFLLRSYKNQDRNSES